MDTNRRNAFILSELQAAPAGMTAKELASATGIKSTVLRDVLATLVATGDVNPPRGQRQTYTVPSAQQQDKAKARARLVGLFGTLGVSSEHAPKFLAASHELYVVLQNLDSRSTSTLCDALEAWHNCCERVAKANAEPELETENGVGTERK